MGFYEDHIKAVAERQAVKMENGEGEEMIIKRLEIYGWEQHEIIEIMRIAKRGIKE